MTQFGYTLMTEQNGMLVFAVSGVAWTFVGQTRTALAARAGHHRRQP